MRISNEEFDQTLAEIIDDDNPRASNLLSVSGIYEILSEYYNNDVIDAIAERRQRK